MIRLAAVLFAWLPIQAANDGLNIRIVEGEGQAYAVGSRATRGITVEITNDLGRPIDGATVTFRLPEQGPSGTFANGSKTEIATTHADGRVNAWGMEWNRAPGLLEIRIIAAKDDARAGTVCALSLVKASEATPAARKDAGHSGHKWLWIAVGIGAVAGGGLAAAHSGAGGSPVPAALSTTTIGTPTIAIGRP